MVVDAAMGDDLQRKGHTNYVLVRFEELKSDLEAMTRRLYRQLGMELPDTTREWMRRTLGGQCSTGSTVGNATNSTLLFDYSTCRAKRAVRSVRAQEARAEARWRHYLSSREKRIIAGRGANALSRFGYTAANEGTDDQRSGQDGDTGAGAAPVEQ